MAEGKKGKRRMILQHQHRYIRRTRLVGEDVAGFHHGADFAILSYPIPTIKNADFVKVSQVCVTDLT